MFPIGASAVDIGEPPVITSLFEQSLFQATAIAKEPDDPFVDPAVDIFFSILGY